MLGIDSPRRLSKLFVWYKDFMVIQTKGAMLFITQTLHANAYLHGKIT